jgi:hypothetical protein
MKVTAKVHAYLPKSSDLTPQELQTEKGVNRMTFFASNDKYWSEMGYTYVGPAEVTVEVPDLREMVENKVAALREEMAATRAKATARCTEIESQIQNLLAIEYTPAATTE